MKTIEDLIRNRESQMARLQSELDSLRMAARLVAEEQQERDPKFVATERLPKEAVVESVKRNQFV